MRRTAAACLLCLASHSGTRGFNNATPPSLVRKSPLLAMMSSSSSGNASPVKITVNNLFETAQFPETWPFSPADFRRQDESADRLFYSSERLVYHIDDGAVGALTKYYSQVLTPGASVLDICSSWVSHFPPATSLKLGNTVGLGMNEYELSQNKQLTSFVAQDLNLNPVMPFADNSFDFVTCVVSVDYLTRPLEVFSELKRVLKPGGTAIFSQSNRCFSTKAINIWLQTNDIQHCFIIGCYFHFAGGFSRPSALDISPNPGRSDPMFIIKATKL